MPPQTLLAPVLNVASRQTDQVLDLQLFTTVDLPESFEHITRVGDLVQARQDHGLWVARLGCCRLTIFLTNNGDTLGSSDQITVSKWIQEHKAWNQSGLRLIESNEEPRIPGAVVFTIQHPDLTSSMVTPGDDLTAELSEARLLINIRRYIHRDNEELTEGKNRARKVSHSKLAKSKSLQRDSPWSLEVDDQQAVDDFLSTTKSQKTSKPRITPKRKRVEETQHTHVEDLASAKSLLEASIDIVLAGGHKKCQGFKVSEVTSWPGLINIAPGVFDVNFIKEIWSRVKLHPVISTSLARMTRAESPSLRKKTQELALISSSRHTKQITEGAEASIRGVEKAVWLLLLKNTVISRGKRRTSAKGQSAVIDSQEDQSLLALDDSLSLAGTDSDKTALTSDAANQLLTQDPLPLLAEPGMDMGMTVPCHDLTSYNAEDVSTCSSIADEIKTPPNLKRRASTPRGNTSSTSAFTPLNLTRRSLTSDSCTTMLTPPSSLQSRYDPRQADMNVSLPRPQISRLLATTNFPESGECARACQRDFLMVCRQIMSSHQPISKTPSQETYHGIAELPSTFPPSTRSDHLIGAYFSTLEPLFRILHKPSFQRTYEDINNPTTSKVLRSASIAMVALVLAIGTGLQHPYDLLDSHHDQALKWLQTVQTWAFGTGEEPDGIERLQILCLIFVAEKVMRKSHRRKPVIPPGFLLVAAVDLNLHRHPEIVPRISLMDKQIWTWLWITIVELNVQHSVEYRLPLLVSPKMYQTPLPLNLDDVDLSTEYATLESATESASLTDCSFQIIRGRSVALRSKVALFLSNMDSEPSYDTVLELGSQLQTSLAEMLSSYQALALMCGDQQVSHTLNEFHRGNLEVYFRRLLLFLHLPFMVLARSNPRFYFSRRVCIENAMAILRIWEESGIHASNGGRNERLRLCLAADALLGSSFDMDAMMALSVDVLTQLGWGPNTRAQPGPFEDLVLSERGRIIDMLTKACQKQFQALNHVGSSVKQYLVLFACLQQINHIKQDRPVGSALSSALAIEQERCLRNLKEGGADFMPLEISGPETDQKPAPAAWLADVEDDDIAHLLDLRAWDNLKL